MCIRYLWNRREGDTRAFVGIVHEFVQMLHELEQQNCPQVYRVVTRSQTWEERERERERGKR